MAGQSCTQTRDSLSTEDILSSSRDIYDTQTRLRSVRLLCSSCPLFVYRIDQSCDKDEKQRENENNFEYGWDLHNERGRLTR